MRTVDNQAYNDSGLAMITREDNADKIQERKNIFIVNIHYKISNVFTVKTHVEHARNLKQKLCGCGIDPFSNDAPRHLPTGKIIEAATVSDIIRAPELGLSQMTDSSKGQ